MTPSAVSIHYRRLPDSTRVFEQLLLEQTADFAVTFLPSADLDRPVLAGGGVALEPGAPVVWFTYPGGWYDIGRFHLVDGTFTGLYANVLTPVKMEGLRWETTDLCLDLWVGRGGEIEILDEGEFAAAVEAGWIDAATATTARETAESLALSARQSDWPPGHVHEWTLERVRSALPPE